MDLLELIKQHEVQVLTLQTWMLGKQVLGRITAIKIEGDIITFKRPATEEPVSRYDASKACNVTAWEPRGDQDLTVPATTEFVIDPFGRIAFSMGKLGLATIFPSHIDPKLPLQSGK
jgi:hypothetical protein